ncbi:PLP-dependent cysteine synthase family protein [Nocardiopsis sp. NPDC050513]|uniref:PLP-dependent cysteine synthase family protein n=1 Tax=Nocardiopsis sp. NPDC050513 TaxID=3364338 RepID=UPI00379EF1C2
MVYDNVLEAVGHTPIVRLCRMSVGNGSEILVKLEGFNPAGSIKDRTALGMITRAELDGRLKPDGTIIESTSGNMGKALAMIGAAKGYRVVLVTDPKAPRSMIDFVRALGAELEIIRTPDENGGYQRPRRERVRQLMDEIPDSFWPDQYNNPDNSATHAERTARELMEEVPDFDALVAAVGTGGHISGVSTALKEERPHVVTLGVDAAGSAAFGYPVGCWAMRGLGIAWPPGNLRPEVVDRVHLVEDHEGIATSRMLARTEGLLVGESAGAAVFGALHFAHHHPGSRIVVVAPDGGVNYLGESFDDAWLEARGIAAPLVRAGLDTLEGLLAAARTPHHPATPRPVGGARP